MYAQVECKPIGVSIVDKEERVEVVLLLWLIDPAAAVVGSPVPTTTPTPTRNPATSN